MAKYCHWASEGPEQLLCFVHHSRETLIVPTGAILCWGKSLAASSLLTEGNTMHSPPLCQLAGVATFWYIVSCRESSTRNTSLKYTIQYDKRKMRSCFLCSKRVALDLWMSYIPANHSQQVPAREKFITRVIDSEIPDLSWNRLQKAKLDTNVIVIGPPYHMLCNVIHIVVMEVPRDQTL